MVLKRTLLALGIVSAMIVGGFLWSAPADAASSALAHNEALIVSRDDCTDANGINFKKCALMTNYINPAIKLLAGVAAIASIVGITIGALQYSSSAGDPQKVSAGKHKVMNGLIGFAAFLFLASFIQFATPGGVQTTPRNGVASAANCGSNFLGLKPWFNYLDASKFDENCAVTGFEILPQSGISDIVPVALAILDDILRIAGLVAVIFVIAGGVKYITSQGEPDATGKAKDTIINAVIGLIIAMVATGVITFIGNQLVK